MEHSDVLFVEFLGDFDHTCQVGGSYSFENGEVVCGLHSEQESEEEDQGEGVQFL
ncbi:hypothetical protein [Pontibacillus sp. HMF3514]|uniref:hypothetical protein n=1 Tax=Pontibacillus sp. HMF3514 TaxID=2692425 RepID=UPI00131F8238|nr:hypothetical protein [Pontibacillus sp. HMF3514]QHE53736.1 hypothetical protein GS400_17695 [Pontibacillus sp. HMF3514]